MINSGDLSSKYLDDDGPNNIELARSIFEYAMPISKILYLARFAILILSIKFRGITKLSLYLELLIQVNYSFMPVDFPIAELHIVYFILSNYMDFSLNYFSFTPSLISSLIALVIFLVNRNIFYGDPSGYLASLGAFYCIWHTFNLLCIHLIITKVGMMYVDTKVLSKGNV